MRRIERLGAELAYAIRERDSRRVLWEHADARVREIERQILEGSTDALEADTTSQPRVPDDRPTEQFAAPAFETCPGSECWAYRQGQDHAHLGGRIWATPVDT
jgi:hypothetical protein